MAMWTDRNLGDDGDEPLLKRWWDQGVPVAYHLNYHLVMTNIAMEHPVNKWRFLAGKIIYFYGPLSMAMLVITRGYIPLDPIKSH